jgi:two-component system nitrogen regulation sensor histidine kinase NtrY
MAMSGAAPFGPDPRNILILLNIDLVLLLLLGAVVASRLVRLWLERRRGSAGSRLHTRMVALFSLIAVTPTIVVAMFSALFLDFGMQSWFNEKVSTALDRSLAVAQAYVLEHREGIRAEALAMATELNRQAPYLAQNPYRLNQFINRLALVRSVSEAVIMQRSGRILARNDLSFTLEFERTPERAIQAAEAGDVVILSEEGDDRVRALIRLDNYLDAYLYVGRFIEGQVVDHTQEVKKVVGDYKKLERERSGIQITFVLIFVVVALLVLFAAVWVGLHFANRLARPIGSLIAAADRVRAGDLSTRVAEPALGDEIGSLSRAFNRMTGQIDSQQQELIAANEQLDDRRRFTEAVLSGVSAGVIGLDARGRITLPNPSALNLLGVAEDALIGRPLEAAIPEMIDLLAQARTRPQKLVESQVELIRDGSRRTLLVRIVAEWVEQEIEGFVVTFDDITALVSAQRSAAWADVARRIAHEIKNPLTPIQLSAERLKRKYLGEISTEPDVFSACTDTIVRQVGDIRQMVDEFSSFARMPAPVMESVDLVDLAQQAVVLQRIASSEITFEIDHPETPVRLDCDPRQINQALTNLLKNAIEAIEARPEAESLPPGHILIQFSENGGRWAIEVLDNGPGLPSQERDRLTEPYVTNRVRGTGLGLAIVRKIMEDHGGDLILSDRADGGASVALVFAASTEEPPARTEGES